MLPCNAHKLLDVSTPVQLPQVSVDGGLPPLPPEPVVVLLLWPPPPPPPEAALELLEADDELLELAGVVGAMPPMADVVLDTVLVMPPCPLEETLLPPVPAGAM
jgi:hypothetical protein